MRAPHRGRARRQAWRFEFAAVALRGAAREGGAPLSTRDRSFRTSVPQISLVGFPAEGRFGPLSRFVEGSDFAAQRVAESLTARPLAA